jgi:hypothetical protein
LKEKNVYSRKIEDFSNGNVRRIKETVNSKGVKCRFHSIYMPRKLWEKSAHAV